ncbi:MAG: thiamine-phosphate kinase [bacterium]
MRVSEIGEDQLIRRLAGLVPSRRDVVAGIGDDCAVVRTGVRDAFDLLLKSDPVIEGIHFSRDAAPGAVGHKAVGRVLSDLAAMGGEPLWALINLVAPQDTPVKRLEGIYRGAASLAKRHGMAIVGGDTSRGKTLELHVFAVGRVPRGRAVPRSGARAGDVLYVTGALGGSGLGRHLKFEPRIREGAWLCSQGWATAMMDVSDGLATDLRRMAAASGTGAILEVGAIPVSPAARRCRDRRSPLEHALADGEDFELLLAVPARKAVAFEAAWRRRFTLRCSRIGVMTKRSGVIELKDGKSCVPLTCRGYEHFVTRADS